MKESEFQSKVIDDLYRIFPGCLVLKNDAGYIQGIPDLVIFYRDRYGFLEVKAAKDSPVQANQPYYVEMLNEMSFAAFIHPDNHKDVLRDLQRALEAGRHTRVPECQ